MIEKTLKGPLPLLLNVELPAVIEEDAEEAFRRLDFKDDQVEFALSKELPNAKAIGDYHSTNALLLRIVKNDEGELVDAEIVGRVEKSVRFRSILFCCIHQNSLSL